MCAPQRLLGSAFVIECLQPTTGDDQRDAASNLVGIRGADTHHHTDRLTDRRATERAVVGRYLGDACS